MSESGIFALYRSGLDALGSVHLLSSTDEGAQIFGASSPVSHKKVLVPTPKQGDHKTSVKNAQQTGKQAVAAGQKLLQQIKQHSKRTKTVGKKLGTAQLTKIANNLVARGQKLIKQAATHKKTVQTVATKQKAGATATKKELQEAQQKLANTVIAKPKVAVAAKKTAVHGEVAEWEEILGDDPEDWRRLLVAYVEVLGDDAANTSTVPPAAPPTSGAPAGTTVAPDPANPGLMADGSVNPAFITGAVAQDTMVQYYQQQLAAYPPQPTTAPPKDPSTYTADPFGPHLDAKGNPTQTVHPWDDPAVYTIAHPVSDTTGNGVPADSKGNPILGAFVYDNQPGLKGNSTPSIASVNRFMRSQSNAAISNPRRGSGSGYQLSSDGWQTRHMKLHNVEVSHYSKPNGKEASDFNAASMNNGWGPLIGNPETGSKFQGLRLATDSNGQMIPFYFYDTAPDRFKTADNITLLAQAVTDWQTNKTALEQQLSAAVVQAQLQQQQADAATQQQQTQQTQADQQAQTDQQAETTQAAQIQTQSDATSQQEQASFQQASAAQQTQADQDRAQAEADADAYESAMAIQEGEPDPHAPPPTPPVVDDPANDAPSVATAIWDSIFGEHIRGVDEVLRRRNQK